MRSSADYGLHCRKYILFLLIELQIPVNLVKVVAVSCLSTLPSYVLVPNKSCYFLLFSCEAEHTVRNFQESISKFAS